jgi:hypothetical protein
MSPRTFIPITPCIAVLYARPMAYGTEPRLTTLVLDGAEVGAFNMVLQVYAKDWLFYKTAKPELGEHFMRKEHQMFTDRNNAVDTMVREIPGVRTRGLFGLDDWA